MIPAAKPNSIMPLASQNLEVVQLYFFQTCIEPVDEKMQVKLRIVSKHYRKKNII